MNAVLAALDHGNGEAVEAAVTALLDLPERALVDNRASRGFGRRLRGRLRRIDAGEELDEPSSAAPQRLFRRPTHPKAKMAAQVHKMLALGSVSKAAKCVDALPMAEPTEEVLAKLRTLHPHEGEPAIPAPTSAPVRITAELLSDVMQRVPKGSAPGESGWTYEHVKAAVLTDPSALSSACRLINAILSGSLPRMARLLDSALIALQKPQGGIRPVAIGEVWLRLAGLCAMAASPDAGRALAPLQLGVGVAGGSQSLGLAMAAGAAANPDDVTLQLDFSNAFNSVKRSAILAATAKRWPEGLAFTAWRYGQPSMLHVRGAPEGTPPIESRRGVQQGDTLGSLLFGLALQDPLEQTRDEHGSVAIAAAHDDCALQGPAAAVVEAFLTLCRLGGDIGLAAHPAKSRVYSANQEGAAYVAEQLGVEHCPDGLVLAGTPLGTDSFKAAYARKATDAACDAIDKLSELRSAGLSAQDHFQVLKSSLQMRGAHLPRCIPAAQSQPAVAQLERKVAQAAAEIMLLPELSGPAAAQMTLPLRLGGLGIRSTTEKVAKASFLSAAALTQAAMLPGPERLRPFAGPSGQKLHRDWQELHAAAGDLWPPEAADTTAECIAQVLPGVQREFYQFEAARKHADLFDSSDVQARARLLSVECRAAAIWLDTLPIVPALTLPNAAFVSGMRHRLGVSHMPANARGVRCSCKMRIEPDDTNHAMTCQNLSGMMTVRHEILKESVRRICQRAGVASSSEPMTRRLHAVAPASQRDESRGDILMVMPDALQVVDISVIHPAASSHRDTAAAAAGNAAAKRDREKRQRYQLADPTGYAFTPFSVESYGRLGKPAMAILKQLADNAGSAGSVRTGDFITNALREISVALVRGNHLMFRRCQGNMANVTGLSPRDGDIHPSAEVH